MMGLFRYFRTAFCLFALGIVFHACAPTLKAPAISDEEARVEAQRQLELAFSTHMRRQDKLLDLAMPLLVSAKDFCKGNVRKTYGFIVHDKNSYGKEYQDIADRQFSLGGSVSVRYVNASVGPAGLMKGDIITAVDGMRAEGMNAVRVKEIIEKTLARDSLKLAVERGGVNKEFEITGKEACNYNARLVVHDAVNAFADGKNVSITTGMLRFVETDDELALVIGHEIAHNAFSHIEKQKGNVLIGTLFDILIYSTTGVDTQGLFGQVGALAYSQDFENEADYAGLYISARAGYGIKDAPLFWRRMAVENPAGIEENYTATHPSSPKRFLALEETIKEIERKKMEGKPLVPDEKKRPQKEPPSTVK